MIIILLTPPSSLAMAPSKCYWLINDHEVIVPHPVGFMIIKRDEAELYLTLQPQHKAASYSIAHLLVDDADALYTLCQTIGAKIIKGI